MRTYFFSFSSFFELPNQGSAWMNDKKNRKKGKKRLCEHGFACARHFVRVLCDSELNSEQSNVHATRVHAIYVHSVEGMNDTIKFLLEKCTIHVRCM